MKHIFNALLSIFVIFTVSAQKITLDNDTRKYQTQGIMTLDSINKEALFSKTKEWITLNYKSAKDVIQLAEKESSKIILKGNFPTRLFMKEGSIQHSVILDFKDGKIRFTYSNFSYYSSSTGAVNLESKSLGFKKKIIQEIEENIISSLQDLKAYIIKNSENKDEW